MSVDWNKGQVDRAAVVMREARRRRSQFSREDFVERQQDELSNCLFRVSAGEMMWLGLLYRRQESAMEGCRGLCDRSE